MLHVRTRGRPESIIQSVRQALTALDPAVPFVEISTLAEEVDASTAGERLTAALASIFGTIAALLTAVGLYGLLAYVVAQRRREIGIRMALGAQTVDIGVLVGRQALAMVIGGWSLGLACGDGGGSVDAFAALRRCAVGSEIARCRRDIRGTRGRRRHSHPRCARHAHRTCCCPAAGELAVRRDLAMWVLCASPSGCPSGIR